MTDQFRDRLNELHALTAQNPLFNPVFQLSLDISRDLEGGRRSLDALDGIIEGLECEAMQSRARRLYRLLSPVDQSDNAGAFRALAENMAKTGDLAQYIARWSRPLLHVVFTGHPTFLLSTDEGDAIAQAASIGAVTSAVCVPPGAHGPITLGDEHAQAIAAMRAAGNARDRLHRIVYEVAARHWPNEWRRVEPMIFRLASWVGYDMDGRTDIGWTTSISFRLEEKAERLGTYAETAQKIGLAKLGATLAAAEAHSREMAAQFATDLSAPSALSDAANRLIANDPAKLLSLAPVIADLRKQAADAEPEQAIAMLTLAAAMQADGLGAGWIHFRVNSSQLHNAIRRRMDPDNVLDMASGTALQRLRTLLTDVKPLRSNFAALAIENTTALRQFMAIAQIIHHIDADAPIRLLIAECEHPQTVLAALYFAKLFGVDHRVDISPLFETEVALEHGARFLDALIQEPVYQQYLRQRGRISIETGFSDAGRFVGQIPAALAIERLQGRLAHILRNHELTDVSALIFNTHGESMGRGAHPSSMTDRLTYPMSQWARRQFSSAGIHTELEVSFQGGDGLLFFGTSTLALATLVRIAEVQTAPVEADHDPFYDRTDLSLDFYRGIRRVQRDHLVSRAYARAITAFGLGLLNQTGSRKSRRQSDLSADREMSLRQIRAIPHNAILQQLGYPLNVIAGFGTAAGNSEEAIAHLLDNSARGRQLVRLITASSALASIKTVAAYGDLFNPAYWASRPYRGTENHLQTACLALAERLEEDDRAGHFRRLASRLRVDSVKLHQLIGRLQNKRSDDPGREETRRSLGVLHALRLALMQHMFLRAVEIPAFSRSNDISRDDVLEMIFTLRIDEAVTQLRRAFPVSAPKIQDFQVAEPSDYPDSDAQAYAGIQRDFIDPIERSWRMCLRISTAIANHFGAHG